MRIYTIDAFTGEPFRGNPAAVCILDKVRTAEWMQRVAAEMNLSETAFLLRRDDGFALRWFTPAVEVDLCGHATIASAHALWLEGEPSAVLLFHTKSGLLSAARDGDWINLDFPAKREERADPPPEMLSSLGITNPVYVGRNAFDYLIEVDSEETLRALSPDHRALRQIKVRGVIVTCRPSDGEYDFLSRFFAPGSGVDEDPVTGSSHCCLGPYWASRLGKNEMLAYQASARGGVVRVRVDGDRVMLGGRAYTVLRGELLP
jgi:PhzF family phenazine biosynthesis protein